MKTKQKSVLLPVLITALMVVTAVSAGIWMTDPDGERLQNIRGELAAVTAENTLLTDDVAALQAAVEEQKALPEAINRQKEEGFRLLGQLEQQIKAGESSKKSPTSPLMTAPTMKPPMPFWIS